MKNPVLKYFSPIIVGLKPYRFLTLAIFVGLVALVLYGFLSDFSNSKFKFLFDATGWDIAFSILPYAPTDPNWWAFVVGLANTIFSGLIGIICSTLLGFLVSLARLSRNMLLADIAKIYTDVIRNIPLILQAMFWYAVVIHFPPPRLAHQFASAVFLSNRGLYIPKFEHSFLLLAFFLLGTVFCIVAFLSYRALKSVGGAWSAVTIPSVIATVIAGTCALMLFFANASAFSVSWPTLTGLNFRGGMQIPPEFTALIAAIVIYRGAFISEVFRAGLSAVGRGQIDAAKSLGLKPWVVLLTIRFPLALISIIPPLSNEFIIIMKITSIGIVVGFYDLFAVTSQAALLTGRALEALLMMMVIYLILNYVMVGIMNFANHRVRARGFVFNG